MDFWSFAVLSIKVIIFLHKIMLIQVHSNLSVAYYFNKEAPINLTPDNESTLYRMLTQSIHTKHVIPIK